MANLDPKFASLPQDKRPSEHRPFQRLFGRAGRKRIYVTDDAVWLVDGAYQETYRRLPYADVQAVICQPLHATLIAGLITGVVMLLLAVFLIGAGSANDFNLPLGVIFGFVAALVLTWGVYGAACGGYCKTYFRTAVQTVKAEALDTRRKTNRFLAQVGGVITAVQQAMPESVDPEDAPASATSPSPETTSSTTA